MSPLIAAIARWSLALHPVAIVAWLLVVNVQWVVTLQAFGAHFEQSAGAPLLDLVNVQGVLTPEAALRLIDTYTNDDIALYWVFFVMDNVVPLLSFGAFALLWAMLLRRSRLSWGTRVAHSWLILLPFAVGGFDIIENLFFVSALSSGDEAQRIVLLSWGLGFVYAKAAALFATNLITIVLLGCFAVGRWRGFRADAMVRASA